jgi:short-subunit dehydrogenase
LGPCVTGHAVDAQDEILNKNSGGDWVITRPFNGNNRRTWTLRSILITGASSGLGEALALAFAHHGIRLFLSGRSEARLAAVVAAAREKGAEASGRVIDVADAEAMAAWVAECDDLAPLDLVIANAGISGGTGAKPGETAGQTREIFATNVDGVMNTVLPVIEPMRSRGRGQIAIMASLAGFRGFPSAPAYCASKAAVRVWGEGLRGWLAADGVGVTVICPGFVRTRMTAVNRFPMPFLMGAEEAARRMKRAIEANRPRYAYPLPMALAVWVLAALPPAWTDRWLRRLPEKE